MVSVPHCTCTDFVCRHHPVNQPDGCTACIAANLRTHDIPACFWSLVDPEKKRENDNFVSFAAAVAAAMATNPESSRYLRESLPDAGPRLEMRFATVSDVWDVSKLEETCFPEAEAASATQMMQRIMYFPEHCWLGFVGGKLVTFCLGMATDEPDLSDDMFANPSLHVADGAWQMIFSVATDPAHQRQGLAAKVIERCIEDTRARGKRGLVLTCKDHMVHYYERLGFVDEGASTSQHGGAAWHQMRLTF